MAKKKWTAAEKKEFADRMKRARAKGGKKKRGKKTGKKKSAGKKRGKKKGSSKKRGKRTATGGCPPAVAHEVKRLADATARLSAENAKLRASASKRGGSKKRRKKAGKKRSKKASAKTTYRHHAHGRVSIVTAKDVIAPKVPRNVTKAWLCAGPKGTGCGGGGKVIAGARVINRKGQKAIRQLMR